MSVHRQPIEHEIVEAGAESVQPVAVVDAAAGLVLQRHAMQVDPVLRFRAGGVRQQDERQELGEVALRGAERGQLPVIRA